MPNPGTSESADSSSRKRERTESDFGDFESLLRATESNHLAHQEGGTADAVIQSFQSGAAQAADVSAKNGVKAVAYENAKEAIRDLRTELKQAAADGNQAIYDIQVSDKDLATKVAEVVGVIQRTNSYALHRSNDHSSKIMNAIQTVLSADGDLRSPEEFMKTHGLAFDRPALPTDSTLTREVENRLSQTRPADLSTADKQNGLGFEGTLGEQELQGFTSTNPTESASQGGLGREPIPTSRPNGGSAPDFLSGSQMGAGQLDVPTEPVGAASGSSQSLPSATYGTSGVGSSGPAPTGLGVTPTGGGSAGLPSSGGLGSGTGTPSLSPESLAQSFNTGMQAGAPASAGAEALSQGISDTVESLTPQNHTPPPAPVAPTVPSSGFAYEAPQQYSEPVQPAPATETHAQPMYAAPVAAAPAAPMAPMAAAPPAATAGPLPAYGSDLRPATAAPPPPPAAPAPMSAPTSAASGTAASNQAPVVRQQNMTTPGSTTTPAGIVESALTSATAGAVAGAAAEQSAAQARLDRLLEAVARQEPKLKWAIGDREDGSTVLVTDLAAGWIPPHIEIPKGVQLLPPERRRGGLEHLLGETVDHSIWTPGHYLPNPKDVEPVEMTYRARQVPDIDELNWELTQATNWRDGLPRLAHTLTKAGIAGTGVLETEADLLYEHLTTVRNKVVKSYPDSVDANDVGNWQLLAAISGLISSDKTTLKYHFAWFQALSMAKQGGAR